MVDDNLTPSECAVLIVLMAEAREISNPELKDRYGTDLSGKSREKLNRLRLVSSRKVERGAYAHQLDDKGWVRVHEELNFDSPRARALGAALTALHGNLRDRVLNGRTFGEMFARRNGSVDLGSRIRSAYASLVREARGWVSFTRLRRELADVPRHELDEALRQLSRADDVNIIPESNQKTLTDEDRQAALRIGGQDKHLLAIGVR